MWSSLWASGVRSQDGDAMFLRQSRKDDERCDRQKADKPGRQQGNFTGGCESIYQLSNWRQTLLTTAARVWRETEMEGTGSDEQEVSKTINLLKL